MLYVQNRVSVIKFPFSYCYNKLKNTKYGRKIDSALKLGKKLIYQPIKWIINKILNYLVYPLFSYLIDRFKESNFYKTNF